MKHFKHVQIAACDVQLGQAERNKVELNLLPCRPEIMTHLCTHASAGASSFSLPVTPSLSHLLLCSSSPLSPTYFSHHVCSVSPGQLALFAHLQMLSSIISGLILSPRLPFVCLKAPYRAVVCCVRRRMLQNVAETFCHAGSATTTTSLIFHPPFPRYTNVAPFPLSSATSASSRASPNVGSLNAHFLSCTNTFFPFVSQFLWLFFFFFFAAGNDKYQQNRSKQFFPPRPLNTCGNKQLVRSADSIFILSLIRVTTRSRFREILRFWPWFISTVRSRLKTSQKKKEKKIH